MELVYFADKYEIACDMPVLSTGFIQKKWLVRANFEIINYLCNHCSVFPRGSKMMLIQGESKKPYIFGKKFYHLALMKFDKLLF